MRDIAIYYDREIRKWVEASEVLACLTRSTVRLTRSDGLLTLGRDEEGFKSPPVSLIGQFPTLF